MNYKDYCRLVDCPLCGKKLKGYDGHLWCPQSIKFQGGKRKFHFVVGYDYPHNKYHNNFGNYYCEMIVYPYRIKTSKDSSIISKHIPPDHPLANELFKSGKWLFKTIFSCPPIQPIEKEKLLQKVKTLVVFS
jgi:hypothetical protein